MQHAFPPDQRELGQHRISVKMSESDDQLTLKVSDNGVGLPPDFVQEDLSSLGVKLTDMLVKQLGGDIAWHTGDGATFIITFPNHRA
jgi:two-component sensor histidine kinase